MLIASISCFAISFVGGLPTIWSFTGTFVPSGNSSNTSSNDFFLRKISYSSWAWFFILATSFWLNLKLATSSKDAPWFCSSLILFVVSNLILSLTNILLALFLISFVGLYLYRGFKLLNIWYSVVKYPPICLWIVFESSSGNPRDKILADMLSTDDLKFNIAFFNGSGSAPVWETFFNNSSSLPPFVIV